MSTTPPRPAPPRTRVVREPDGVRRIGDRQRFNESLTCLLTIREKATGAGQPNLAWAFTLWGRVQGSSPLALTLHGLAAPGTLWQHISDTIASETGGALPEMPGSFEVAIPHWTVASDAVHAALHAPPPLFHIQTEARRKAFGEPHPDVIEQAENTLHQHYAHLPDHHEAPASQPPSPLDCHTDGSYLRGRRIGGAAAVFDRGRWAALALPDATSPYECEIRAALLALAVVPRNIPVRIHTDSKNLVTAMRRHERGLDVHAPSRPAHDLHRLRMRMADRTASTEFVWVPGHTGEGLNDAADRLARLSARHHADDVDTTMTSTIAQRILADVGLAGSRRLRPSTRRAI